MSRLEEKSDYCIIQKINKIEVKKCKFGVDTEKLKKEKKALMQILASGGTEKKL